MEPRGLSEVYERLERVGDLGGPLQLRTPADDVPSGGLPRVGGTDSGNLLPASPALKEGF